MPATTRTDPQFDYGHRQSPPRPFIWREFLWTLDWLSLRLSPVYLGKDVPHGDGGPVVLVPGFLTTDIYLTEMRYWLRRIGYRAYSSRIGVNADCIETLTRRLEKRVEDIHARTGRPVRLIGHSLGGLLARRLAVHRPDLVSQLVSLGSPIQALEAHPAIMAAARLVGERIEHLEPGSAARGRGPGVCLSERCECLAGYEASAPPPGVRRAAVYTRSDGVVPWTICLEPEPDLNYDVGGSHLGLAFNPRAYRVVAELLAEAPGGHRRRAM